MSDIEAWARAAHDAIRKYRGELVWPWDAVPEHVRAEYRAMIAAVAPLIRAAALEEAAEWVENRFSEAVQADTENGVKWLNERAAAEYLKDAPDTLAAIRDAATAIRKLKERGDE